MSIKNKNYLIIIATVMLLECIIMSTGVIATVGQNIKEYLKSSQNSSNTIIEATKISYVDPEGNPYSNQSDVPINAEVQINYTWSIPEDILPLKSGDYFDFQLPKGVTVQEVSGLLGEYGTYILDPKPIKFELKANEEGIIPEINLEKVNYKGSAQLIKHDSNGQVTANDLAPGEYSFIETQAPIGYQLSKETKTFEITTKAKGKPQVINAGKLINKRLPVSPKKQILPHTGEKQNNWLLFGILLIILIIQINYLKTTLSKNI